MVAFVCAPFARSHKLRIRSLCSASSATRYAHFASPRATAAPPPDDSDGNYTGPRFDPNSDKDAFGRDPRKETDFWRSSARDLLDSQEVRDAIDGHAQNPVSVDPEREAYLQFLRDLDAGSASEPSSDPSTSTQDKSA